MNGQQLGQFITGLNGGADIDSTLLNVIINTAKTIIESERDWMVLRKTDTSKTITPASTWDTAIDLSTIDDFSHFHGDYPIRLFDGINRREYYRYIPWDSRLEYKDISNTFTYDDNSKTLYINGRVAYSGTLYINYVSVSDDIDVESIDTVWTEFLPRFTPMLGFYAIGIHMGGVDYDTITARMAPNNLGTMIALKNAMATWDDKRQLSSIEGSDPSLPLGGGYPRAGAVNRTDD